MRRCWLAFAMGVAGAGMSLPVGAQEDAGVSAVSSPPTSNAGDLGAEAPEPAAASSSASAGPNGAAASADDAPSAPATRFDPASGAVAEPDRARGWDEAPGVEDQDVALFLPRVVLLVPKLALSVVFFLPRLAMKAVDELHLIQRVEDVLYFDDAHDFGWTPLVSYQAGYGPTGGAKLFHKSLLGHGEEVSISGVYGGRYTQAYRFAFNADRLAGTRLWLDAQARYEAEPGLLFGGIGVLGDDEGARGSALSPRASNRLTYLSQERALGLLRLGYTAGQRRELVKLGTTAIFNNRSFEPNSVGKRQIGSVYDLAAIPGFDDRVTTLELQGNLFVDLRENSGLDTRGLYMEGFFGGVPELDRYNYLHYGAELAYTIDLYRATRLLRLRVALEAVEGELGKIPFTDLPRLGGVHRLRGYVEAQFRDKRATVASVEYHYPIHANVSGELFVDTGYVAARYRDLFELDRWKIGYGGGFLFGSANDIALRLDLAYGDGFAVYLSTDLAQAFDGRSDQL